MDLAQQLRTAQAEQFVVAVQITAMISKALAAIIGFREFVILQHGAHGAVYDEHTLLHGLLQALGLLRIVPRQWLINHGWLFKIGFLCLGICACASGLLGCHGQYGEMRWSGFACGLSDLYRVQSGLACHIWLIR